MGRARPILVWDRRIRLALNGRCSVLTIEWPNLGVLLRKRMLWRVSAVVFMSI